MAKEQRKALLLEAEQKGLILGVDFQPNISNTNLKNLIDARKESLTLAAQEETESEDNQEQENTETTPPIDDAGIEDEEEINEDEITITITSLKAGHKETASSYEEASKKTNVPVELIKNSIISNKMIFGYRFSI